VTETASRISPTLDLVPDVQQEMWLELFRRLAPPLNYVPNDKALEHYMRNAALRFVSRVAYDAPLDRSGNTDSSRMEEFVDR
jgi:hypothetical protein